MRSSEVGTRPAEAIVAAIRVGAVAAILWLPALSTPFWGDDYVFLEDALRARLSGESWLAPFWPDRLYQFWRPLGHETYWRFVEQVLGSDARLAHATNFALWLCGCSSVGVFGATLSSALGRRSPVIDGGMGAAIYSVLALHFTPLHWTSSADSLFIVITIALAPAAWTHAPRCSGWVKIAIYACVFLMQVLALVSKESGVVLPALMLCVTAFIAPRKPAPAESLVLLCCAICICTWLYLRQPYVWAVPVEYAPRLGWNVLRNLASMSAWLLNVPREALRMLVVGSRYAAALWIIGTVVPMAIFLASACAAMDGVVWRRRGAWLAAFICTAYAPYVLLSWQSYEYYAEVAAILPAVLLAQACVASRPATLALAALCLSSTLAIEGSRRIGYPGLIARAMSGEEQISAVVGRDLLDPDAAEEPLAVSVTNPHRFYAIGQAGLTWRLGRTPEEIVMSGECGLDISRVLEINEADLRVRECPVEDAVETP